MEHIESIYLDGLLTSASKPNVCGNLHTNINNLVLSGGIDGKGLDCFGLVATTLSAVHAPGRKSTNPPLARVLWITIIIVQP